MEANNSNDFIIQLLDKEITSAETHELKASMDKDYKYIVGIAISDTYCSQKSILESVKIKSKDLLPEKTEAVIIMSSINVAPNKRFFALFKAVEISGEELVIKFADPDWRNNYNLQIHVLLTNNPKSLYNVLYS